LKLVTPRPNAIYECQIDTPIKAKKIQNINLSEAPVRSARAGGLLLFPRKMLKITFVQYLDGTEQTDEPALIQVPSESHETVPDDPPPQKPAAEETDAAPKTIVEKPTARSRKRPNRHPQRAMMKSIKMMKTGHNTARSRLLIP
jgi:hypothetical protein